MTRNKASNVDSDYTRKYAKSSKKLASRQARKIATDNAKRCAKLVAETRQNCFKKVIAKKLAMK